MNQAPWTDIGSLQNDVRQLQNDLNNKANNYEIYEINRRLDSLEHTCGQLRSALDEILFKLQTIQENQLTPEK